MNQNNTFWKLINNHRVEIPIIQRDYAQGRDEQDDPKAAQIRKKFVTDLVTNLDNRTAPVHLDFVYGKINGRIDVHTRQKNKTAIDGLLKSVKAYSDTLKINIKYEFLEKSATTDGGSPDTTFVPLDGQQRLTTLYLLHWYLLTRTQKSRTALLNFTYRTRPGSDSFCRALSTADFLIDDPSQYGAAKQNLLSSQISDRSWFFSYWRKDPTVKGMLKVLDEIHGHLSSYSIERLEPMLKSLTESDLISFDFLDMDKFELTDDLYVKMNARGKQLSDFENFKTWIQEHVKKENLKILTEEWHKRIDIQWADLFWRFKKKNSFEVDDQYMAFFNLMALNTYAGTLEVNDSKISAAANFNFDLLRKNDYISPAVYKSIGCFSETELNHIFYTLSALEGNGYHELETILKPLYPDGKDRILSKLLGPDLLTINLWDRCYLHALICFISARRINVSSYSDEERRQLFEWARVTKNLIYNSTIDSTPDYISALKSIIRLSEHQFQIYSYLASDYVDEVLFLSPAQLTEEKVKCRLIAADGAWENELIDAENHAYFYGQIGFLLLFSRINKEDYFKDFIRYAAKAKVLFSDEAFTADANKFRLQRALLTKGNFLIESGGNISFCRSVRGTLRQREENWRRLFRNNEKNLYLKDLLDDDRALIDIINESPVTDWRRVFISAPKCIGYCNQRMIKVRNDSEVTLLSQSQMNHYHTDLYLYALWIMLEKSGTLHFSAFNEQIRHNDVKSSNEEPCLRLKSFSYGDSLYTVAVYSEGSKAEFSIEFYNQDQVDIHDNIKTSLANLSFEEKGLRYSKNVDEQTVADTLRSLSDSLLKIQ
ncbi:DUF262 domain-containing protein [Mucilaginibacter conchicola]|nr:DUF262 domain-containing protein [Mucilaginibacter conchicola]